jgi:hypothetical protein
VLFPGQDDGETAFFGREFFSAFLQGNALIFDKIIEVLELWE